jgi:hypothetical protein
MMTERDESRHARNEALTPEAVFVALVLAPGVYSRNRMFQLFRAPQMERMRLRARFVRGLFRQFSRSQALGLHVQELRDAHADVQLRYEITQLRLVCRVELTSLERACLGYLCGKSSDAWVRGLVPERTEERALVDSHLAQLARSAGAGLSPPSTPRGSLP